MTLSEIKKAVNEGITVYVGNLSYTVTENKNKELMITTGNYSIGLTYADGETLNAKESDFFILENKDDETKESDAVIKNGSKVVFTNGSNSLPKEGVVISSRMCGTSFREYLVEFTYSSERYDASRQYVEGKQVKLA